MTDIHDFNDLVPNDLDTLPAWMFEGFDYMTLGMNPVPRFMRDVWFRKYDALEWIEQETPDVILTQLNICLGSSARLQWLVAHQDVLSDKTLAAILPDLWIDPNMLAPPIGFTSELALDLFDRVGFLSDGPARPTETQRVYHGVVGHTGHVDLDDWSSLCWTTDLDIAIKFATYSGLVFAGYVAPEHVLARFDARGESEWVVDPLNVSDKTVARSREDMCDR